MNLLKTVFTKLMIGPGDQDVKRHTEIVDLNSGDGLAQCPDIASYPIALNYAGVGAFVNGGGRRGLICGGYNDYNTNTQPLWLSLGLCVPTIRGSSTGHCLPGTESNFQHTPIH